MAKRLQTFEMWTDRRILWISWTDKMRDETVLNRLDVKNRLFKITQGVAEIALMLSSPLCIVLSTQYVW